MPFLERGTMLAMADDHEARGVMTFANRAKAAARFEAAVCGQLSDRDDERRRRIQSYVARTLGPSSGTAPGRAVVA